jgi:hypothetical protein
LEWKEKNGVKSVIWDAKACIWDKGLICGEESLEDRYCLSPFLLFYIIQSGRVVALFFNVFGNQSSGLWPGKIEGKKGHREIKSYLPRIQSLGSVTAPPLKKSAIKVGETQSTHVQE